MAKTKIAEGPIGNGWIEEVKTADGTKFVARWNCFVTDPEAPGGRRRVRGGSYEIGPKVSHGPEGALKSKKKALNEWLKICDSVMGRSQDLHPLQMAGKPFKWFTEEIFEKSRATRWRETSKYTFGYYKAKLFKAFSDVPLQKMNDADMQEFLNGLVAQKYSRSVVEHSLKYLKAILAHAVDIDVLGKSPARWLKLPDGTRAPDRPYLSITEYLSLLDELPTKRDQIMARMLYLGGLRRGELFGLRWGDFDGETIRVVRQINRFQKEALVKTDKSEKQKPIASATIVVPVELAKDLTDWRGWCLDSSPNAFMFQSKSGSAIHYKNWLDRTLKPAAKRAGMGRIGFHMFRRGLATEAHQHGEVDKNVQGQMRHDDLGMTRLYMQGVPEGQKQAVNRLEQAINERAAELRKAAAERAGGPQPPQKLEAA